MGYVLLFRLYTHAIQALFGEYILEQSVSVRAIPKLIVERWGAAIEFFNKASPSL